MALTRTDVGLFESKGSFGTAAYTTPSFTPPANSLLCIAVFFIGNGTEGDLGTPLISGGGLTYTSRTSAFGAKAWSMKLAVFTAPVGGSPSSMTITVDDDNNQNIAGYTVSVIAFTGYDTTTPIAGAVSSGSTDIKDGEEVQTLAATPTAEDVTLAYVEIDGEPGPPKPKLAAGWALNHEGRFYSSEGGVFAMHREGSTSTEVKVTDVWTSNTFYKGAMVSLIIKAAKAGGKALTLELSDSAAFSESRGGGAAAAQADPLPLADALQRAFALSRGDAIATADALGRRADLSRADTLAVEELLAKTWVARRQLGENLTAADAKAYSLERVLADVASLVDVAGVGISTSGHDAIGLLELLELALQRVVSDALSLGDDVTRSLGLTLADAVALVDELEGTGAAGTALEDLLQLGDQRRLDVGHVQLDQVAGVDAIAKAPRRSSADAVSLGDTTAARAGHVEADDVVLGDAIAKATVHVEADAIGLSESIGKRMSTTIADVVALADGLARKAAKFLTDLLGLSEASDLEGGEVPELPAYLALSDSPSPALAVADRASPLLSASDRPVPALGLSDRPTTTLTLEDRPA